MPHKLVSRKRNDKRLQSLRYRQDNKNLNIKCPAVNHRHTRTRTRTRTCIVKMRGRERQIHRKCIHTTSLKRKIPVPKKKFSFFSL